MATPGTIGIRLKWDDQNDFEEGFKVYRDTSTFDKDSLPGPPIATLPPNTEVYVDEDVDLNTDYHYMISTFVGGVEVFAPQTVKAKADAGPAYLGEAYGGGYYIGNVTVADGDVNDGVYAIIVAPASADSGSKLNWKTANNDTPNTSSLTDGARNTYAMDAAGLASHPAAEFCLACDEGGFSDWYLPAKDELNLAYVNRNELPVIERLTADYYWTSSQASDLNAWSQSVSNGTTSTWTKTGDLLVRPVRRLKLMI